jgi:hypothetical protein
MGVDHEFEVQPAPAAEDIEASRSGSRWAVATTGWTDLPPEVVELLAAPIVVSTAEVTRAAVAVATMPRTRRARRRI